MIKQLLYSSKAAPGVELRDVCEIIRVSHNRNSHAGLTGGLLFLDGYFFQLLEGLPGSVDERYRRIAQDPRHSQVELRHQELVGEPLFADEWMALRDHSQVPLETLLRHHYEPGMPSCEFSSEQMLALLLDCFERESIHATLVHHGD
jgi:hypothetical protein